MIKLAMVRIHRCLQQQNLRTKMILQVHDELVFDLYRPEEALVRQIVAHEMKQALPLPGIEIEVGIDVGDNWLEAH
jgi:DNA polymerase-1